MVNIRLLFYSVMQSHSYTIVYFMIWIYHETYQFWQKHWNCICNILCMLLSRLSQISKTNFYLLKKQVGNSELIFSSKHKMISWCIKNVSTSFVWKNKNGNIHCASAFTRRTHRTWRSLLGISLNEIRTVGHAHQWIDEPSRKSNVLGARTIQRNRIC